MKNYCNFKIYHPQNEIIKKLSIAMLQADDGSDWYESQKTFKNDSLKVVYDKENRIISASYDVSALWPINASVAEVSEEQVPGEFSIAGDWSYLDGKIVKRQYTQQELVQQATFQRELLFKKANETIAPLQDAIDLNIETDEEKSRLLAWKKYRVLLSRLDLTVSPSWPAIPE